MRYCLALVSLLVFLGSTVAVSPDLAAQQPASPRVGTPQLPRFSPPINQWLVYRHIIKRPAGATAMTSTISRCVRFTPIGRGYRFDTRVVDVTDTGPAPLLEMLHIGSAIKRDEALVLDLGASGEIIGVYDLNATWERLVAAAKRLRSTLDQQVASSMARMAGAQLLDTIITMPMGERASYFASAVRPILGLADAIMADSKWIYPATGETALPIVANGDIARFAIGPPPSPALDSYVASQSEGTLEIGADGLLYSVERTIRVSAMGTERVNRDIWERIDDPVEVQRFCTLD
ncbi:MAG: hypothetical protein AAGH53_05700 [Pseudomonadota bacterium]